MTMVEYKEKVIALFKSEIATDAQWQEMANAVLRASEDDWASTESIDIAVGQGRPEKYD